MIPKQTSELLYTLGIGRQYLGHSITMEAVEMVLRDENRLLCVKQGIFVPLGQKRGCDWRTIERNIRTVIRRAWRMSPTRMSEMAVYPLKREPTVTEFLDLLAVRVMRGERDVRSQVVR